MKLGRIGGMPAQEVARLGEAMRLEFGLASEEFEKVADKLAKIGFMGPATIKGLLEGGSRVGGVWKQAGGQLDEVFAIIAAGRMGGRTESEVANAVRTMMVRLGQPTHQEKAYEITRKATGTGMEFGNVEGGAKPPWEIFSELKAIFTKMDEKGREDLSKQLGFEVGSTRGANILASIMTNFATAEDMLKKQREGSTGALNIKAAESLNTFKGATDRASAALDILWAKASGPGGIAKDAVNAATVAIQLVGGGNVGEDQSQQQTLVQQLARLKETGFWASTADAIALLVGEAGLRAKKIEEITKQLWALQHPGVPYPGGPGSKPPMTDAEFEKRHAANVARGNALEMGPRLPEPEPMGPPTPPEEAMGPPLPGGFKGPLQQASEIKAAMTALEESLKHAKGADAVHALSLSFDELLEKARKAGPVVKEAVEGFVEKQKIDEKIANAERASDEHAYSIQLRGLELVSRAKSKYEAEAFGGGKKGPHKEELEALQEQKDLENELARLKGTTGPLREGAAAALENEELRVQEALEQQIFRIGAAQWNDKRRMNEEQQRENDALQKKLGMLSDEDMLKARIMAGEMKRGEIGKSMDVGEFSQMGASFRKMYGTIGGKVTGQFGGLGFGGEGAAGPETPAATSRPHPRFNSQGGFLGYEAKPEPSSKPVPVVLAEPPPRATSEPPRPPAPRYSAGATGGNVSQDPMTVSNAHVFAVAIAHEIAAMFKLPLPVSVQSRPESGTARGGPR